MEFHRLQLFFSYRKQKTVWFKNSRFIDRLEAKAHILFITHHSVGMKNQWKILRRSFDENFRCRVEAAGIQNMPVCAVMNVFWIGSYGKRIRSRVEEFFCYSRLVLSNEYLSWLKTLSWAEIKKRSVIDCFLWFSFSRFTTEA